MGQNTTHKAKATAPKAITKAKATTARTTTQAKATTAKARTPARQTIAKTKARITGLHPISTPAMILR